MAAGLKRVLYGGLILTIFILFSSKASLAQENENYKPDTMSVVLNSDSIRNQDLIQVLDSPSVINSRHVLTVEYRCSRRRIAGLEIVANTEGKRTQKIFQKAWKCSGGPQSSVRKKLIKLSIPAKYGNRPDRFNPYFITLSNPRVRAWLLDPVLWKRTRQSVHVLDLYMQAFVKVSYNSTVLTPYLRPVSTDKCLPWSSVILSILDASKIGYCPQEKEVLEAVEYPLAVSGLHYGTYRAFQKYQEPILERARSTEHQEFTVSMWVYILEYCVTSHLCSLMHHFSDDDIFLTPLICVNTGGHLHIQVALAEGTPHAVLSPFQIPKLQWVHLVFTFIKRKWYLSLRYGENFNLTQETSLTLPEDVDYDDTAGLFTFGGSQLMPAFKGYIGQATVFRNTAYTEDQIPPISLYHPMFELGISAREQRCITYTDKIQYRIYQSHILRFERMKKENCPDFFQGIRWKGIKGPQSNQCPVWRGPKSKQYHLVNKVVKQLVLTSRMVNDEDIGDAIYNQVVTLIEDSIDNIPIAIKLLKQAACYNSYDAMYMLSVILSNGFQTKADEIQSHAYLMLAAIEKHRLSMMSLGNKHNLGIDGVPTDKEQAYMYYKYVADRAREDREQHKDSDVMTESVRLTDEFQLNEQTDEEGDIYMWMKLQAQQGVLAAQQWTARSLFWGSQGLRRNVQAALEYFRLGAEHEDPTAMYDYGIVLMRGQGTEKNTSKGLQYLEKSANKGNPNALSALGWHALENEKNYTRAATLLGQAYRLGNADAGHNLGHMYLTGKYPNHTIDKHKAFKMFEWAAIRGQFDAGVMLAYFFMRGTDKMQRTVNLALEWARYVAEKNPHMGHILRKALTSYRNGNVPLSLFYYMMAAESGIEVGNFNLALLCEENKEGLATMIEKECQWRYFNRTIQREEHHVDPYALIKMGDYYWYGCGGDRNDSLAADYYSRAANKHDPHAIFNLAFMIEEGARLSVPVLNHLGIPLAARENNVTLLTELYTRCKESPKTEAFIPCSLALWRIQLMDVWMRYHLWMTLSSAIGIAVVTSATVYSIYVYVRGAQTSTGTDV